MSRSIKLIGLRRSPSGIVPALVAQLISASISVHLLLFSVALLSVATAEAQKLQEAAVQTTEETKQVDSLTLADALAMTVLQSPELESYSFEIRAREAAALQAGLPVNPELSFELENFAGNKAQDGIAGAEATVRLSQLLELGGKKQKRAAVGRHSKEVADQEYATARIKLLAETTKAFFSAKAQEEQLALAADLVKSAQSSVRISAALVKAGAATDVEVLRNEVAVGQVEAERERQQGELTAAYELLASFWGGRRSFSKLSGDLSKITEPLPLDELLSKLPESQDLKRLDAERLERQAALELERAGAVPDLTVGIGARRFNEDDSNALLAELSLPLPIFNRNQGAIEEASVRLQKLDAERHQALVQLEAELRSSYAAMKGAYQEVTRLGRVVIPKAKTALAGAREGYERGIFRALEVLDAERTLFEVRAQHVRGLETYHRANAEIERILGLTELKFKRQSGE